MKMGTGNSWIGAILAASVLTLGTGCGPRIVSETVYEAEADGIDVLLRHQMRRSEPVQARYNHPIVISDIRLAHILGILVASKKGRAQGIFRPDQVYPLAQGMKKALAQANPNQEVAARLFYVEKNLGVFTSSFVTAFRAYARGDSLIIEFFEIRERVERTTRDNSLRNYDLPKNLPDSALSHVLAAGDAHRPYGKRGVSIDWRHPQYRAPISFTSRGRISRREVLMEAEPEAEAPGARESIAITPELQRAQMAALDQIDQLRRSGLITEAEFQRRRRLILEGKVKEAGYEPEP